MTSSSDTPGLAAERLSEQHSILALMPFNAHLDLHRWQVLVSCIRRAEALLDGTALRTPEDICLGNRLGALYGFLARHSEQAMLQERCLQAAKILLGSEHSLAIEARLGLAEALQAQDRLQDAQVQLDDALACCSRLSGKAHPLALEVLRRLMLLLLVRLEYTAALRIGERLVSLCGQEASVITQQISMWATVSSGYVRHMLEPKPGIKESMTQALGELEQVCGKEHGLALEARSYLITVLSEQGDWSRARQLCQEHVAIQIQWLGADHPATLQSRVMLAEVIRDNNDADAACRLLEQVNEAARHSLGNGHPRVLTYRVALGLALRKQGDLNRALEVLELAVEDMERVLDADSYKLLSALSSLGITAREAGDPTRAGRLQQHVLDSYRRLLGDEHAWTIGAMYNMGLSMLDERRYEDARPLWERVLAWAIARKGKLDDQALIAKHNLAICLYELGDPQSALELEQESLEGLRTKKGANHPDTLQAMGDMAALLDGLGRYSEAAALGMQAFDGLRKIAGDRHPMVLYLGDFLLGTLNACGNRAAAERLEQEVQAIKRQLLADSHESAGVPPAGGSSGLTAEPALTCRPSIIEQTRLTPLTALTLSRDGRWMAIASGDRQWYYDNPVGIRLWDLRTGQPMRFLERHYGWITALAFSPDCSRLISVSDDKGVIFWPIAEGQERLIKGDQQYRCLASSPDGRQIAIGGTS